MVKAAAAAVLTQTNQTNDNMKAILPNRGNVTLYQEALVLLELQVKSMKRSLKRNCGK